jgi:hypothetical protein
MTPLASKPDLTLMTVDAEYERSWADYRFRQRLMLFVFFGYVPGVAVTAIPLVRLFGSNIPFYSIAGIWMVGYAASGIYSAAWRCPRCRRRFHFGSLGRRCGHCKLPKWSVDPTA